MKKIIFIFLVFILIVLGFYEYFNQDTSVEEVKKEEIKGVFISYIDYSNLKGKNELEQKKIIDEMINNIYDYGLNTIILQVRPFSDAIYCSEIFKPSLSVVNSEDDYLNFDILKYFIDKTHLKDMKLYAWINPYRIRNTNDIESISKNSIFYDYLSSDDVYIGEDGIYFNPSSKRVLDLIISGVEEVVKNYDIDGILYDDYFYPNNKIDNNNYNKYVEEGGVLSINEYRLEVINNLISSTYNTVKKIKNDVLFGISPSGNIENNLNNEYLDVEYLLSKEGYLDFVIPQVYYGFNNTNKPYIDTLNTWNKLIKTDTKLMVALSIYKSGQVDEYAKEGKNEWIENSDIIKKQIIIARNVSNYEGFFIFRYNYLFSNDLNTNLKNEIDNLKSILSK